MIYQRKLRPLILYLSKNIPCKHTKPSPSSFVKKHQIRVKMPWNTDYLFSFNCDTMSFCVGGRMIIFALVQLLINVLSSFLSIFRCLSLIVADFRCFLLFFNLVIGILQFSQFFLWFVWRFFPFSSCDFISCLIL